MSDYEAPSTNYANEIDLTTGSDVVDGGPNDLIVGELTDGGAGGLDTFNPSDIINSGGTLRLTATGDNIDFAGASVENVNAVEIRNFTNGDTLSLNTINWGDIPNWVSFNTTGGTDIYNIGGAGDFTFNGGPGGDPAYFSADFLESVHSGGNDEMHFLLDGANVDLMINNYTGSAVETGHFIGNGTASTAYFNVYGMEDVLVTGDAPSLDLWQTEGHDGPGAELEAASVGWLSSVDASDFAGDLYFYGYLGNGNAGFDDPVTFVSSGGDDNAQLWGDSYNSDLDVNTGAGKDTVDAHSFHDILINTGTGGDDATLYADGTVNLKTSKGSDDVDVNAGTLIAGLGNGNDLIDMNVSGNATVKGGAGRDTVNGWAGGDAELVFGGGNNSGNVGVGNDALVKMGNGHDDLTLTAGGSADINANDGNNYLNVSVGNGILDEGIIRTGSGADTVYASGNHFDIITNAGADMVDINNVSGPASAIVKLGGGNDSLDVGSRGLISTDIINFAGGDDTLLADNLAVINGAGELNVVNPGSLENIVFGETSGLVTFNGATTGANTSGAMNYTLEGNLSADYDFVDMADGVTINMSSDLFSFNDTDMDIDLAGSGGTANFNFDAGSSHVFSDFNVSDVGTLNLVTEDVDNSIFSIPTVTFGREDESFNGDADLTIVNLAGNTHINMGGVSAMNLAAINAGTVTGNMDLQLINVASATSVTTGSGNDEVEGLDAAAAYNVTTDGGNDTVMTNALGDTISTGSGDDQVTSRAGIDNIDLGSGNDWAFFTASQLTSADAVAGGADFDTVQITSGALDRVDDFFFQWSGVERLELSSSADTLQFNAIANAAGLEEVSLGGGTDSLTLGEGFTNDLEVFLAGDGSSVMVDATGTTNNLTISGDVSDFNFDTLMAGTGTGDVLQMTADGGAVTLDPLVTGFETLTVWQNGSLDASITTDDGNVAAGQTLLVDASDLTGSPFTLEGHAPGDLTFDGSAETDGMFNLTSGQGNDNLMTGAGNDTVNAGEGNDTVDAGEGNNTVNAGNGANEVVTGEGTDDVTSGSGADLIATNGGNDTVSSGGGNDTIDAGDGNDMVDGGANNDNITGGLGADNLTGGSGINTFVYTALAESSAAIKDTIADFVSGVDKLDFTGLAPLDPLDSMAFIGNGADFGQTQGLLIDGDGVAGVVFQQDSNILWVDLNDDGTLNADDLQINLSGVASVAAGDVLPYVPV